MPPPESARRRKAFQQDATQGSMPNQFKVLISAKRIERIVRKLAGEIDLYARANCFSELSVVCVMDGAFVFCADLVRQLKTPTAIVFVKARSYNGARSGPLSLAALP